jgi:hypothetical protein
VSYPPVYLAVPDLAHTPASFGTKRLDPTLAPKHNMKTTVRRLGTIRLELLITSYLLLSTNRKSTSLSLRLIFPPTSKHIQKMMKEKNSKSAARFLRLGAKSGYFLSSRSCSISPASSRIHLRPQKADLLNVSLFDRRRDKAGGYIISIR